MRAWKLAVSTMAMMACSGTAGNGIGLEQPGSGTGSGSGSGTGTSGSGAGTSGSGTSAPANDSGPEPRVYIRINAVQTPVGSGTSRETPVDQRVGVLGVTLMKSVDDPSPLTVLSLETPADTPYNAGSSTLLGSVPASALTAGTYTVVRVPVAYVNFTVAGTYNEGTTQVPGNFEDIIALTNGTMLNGAARDRGWYTVSFMVDGTSYGTTSGSDSAIAQPGPESGIGLDLSGAVAAYVFPLTLTIPEQITQDQEIVFTANTYEDFVWQPESEPGYSASVYEVTATGGEPVTQLGANSCTVTMGPVSSP